MPAQTAMRCISAIGLRAVPNDNLPYWQIHTPDPGQTVEALESSLSPHHRTTRKRPFGFRRCCSRLTGSFEVGAVTGCRMASGGIRPQPEVRPRPIADLQTAAPLQNQPDGQWKQLGHCRHSACWLAQSAMSRLAAAHLPIRLSGSFSFWRIHTPCPMPLFDPSGLL